MDMTADTLDQLQTMARLNNLDPNLLIALYTAAHGLDAIRAIINTEDTDTLVYKIHMYIALHYLARASKL